MADSEKFFKPETVDEQIEQLSLSGDNRAFSQATGSNSPDVLDSLDARLIHDLKHIYQTDEASAAQSLDRAWERIERQYSASPPRQHIQQGKNSDGQTYRYARYRHMDIMRPSSSRKEAITNRIGIIAAVVFLALLVGSMAVVLNFAHHGTRNRTIGAGPVTGSVVPQATPTVTPAATKNGDIGKIVYTSPSTQSFFDATWSPDSQRIAVIDNGGIEAWDATTGKHVTVYAPAITSGCTMMGASFVAWSADGKRIAGGATIGSTNTVAIWDATSTKLLATYPHTTGNITNTRGGCSGMSSTMGLALKRISTSSTRGITPLSGYISSGSVVPLLSMAWSPDGKEIAASFGYGMNGSKIQIWDTTTGKLVKTYQDARYTDGLAWSPNGKYLAFGSSDGVVQVWNAATWQPIIEYSGDHSSINTLAWSPDSTRIISAGNTVMVWNALTGKTLFTLPGNANGVYAVAWSPDGTEIATGVNHVQIWNATSGKGLYTFTKNPYVVDTIAWSPNGKYIASVASPPGRAGGNGIVQVWIA